MTLRRDFVALAVAPLAGAIIAVVLSVIAFALSDRVISTGPDPYTPEGGWNTYLYLSLPLLWRFVVVLYVCTVVVGVPTHMLLRARRITSLTAYAISGGAWPLFMSAAYVLSLAVNNDGLAYPPFFFLALLQLTLIGAAIAATFWTIAVRVPKQR